jgi:hypothetical protein
VVELVWLLDWAWAWWALASAAAPGMAMALLGGAAVEPPALVAVTTQVIDVPASPAATT